MRTPEKFTKKLLVEGNDDQHILWSLCERFNVTETFDVIDCVGVNNLLDEIPIRLKQSGIEAMGIIIDADIEISARWQSVSVILNSVGCITPTAVPADGLIVEHSGVRIGIWMMPNNSVNGMIEDFIGFLVPEDDQLFSIANKVVNQIEAEGLNKYNIIHKSKALIHTWLSWQEEPGTPMGLSITKRYLTTDTKICETFIDWLNGLFNS